MQKDSSTNLPLPAVYLKAAGELIADGKLSVNRVAYPIDDEGDWLLSVAGRTALVEFNPHPWVGAAITKNIVELRRESEKLGIHLASAKSQLPDVESAEAHLAFLASQVEGYKVTKGDKVAEAELSKLKNTLTTENIRLGDVPKWREDVEARISKFEAEIANVNAQIKELQDTKLIQRKTYEFKY